MCHKSIKLCCSKNKTTKTTLNFLCSILGMGPWAFSKTTILSTIFHQSVDKCSADSCCGGCLQKYTSGLALHKKQLAHSSSQALWGWKRASKTRFLHIHARRLSLLRESIFPPSFARESYNQYAHFSPGWVYFSRRRAAPRANNVQCMHIHTRVNECGA